MSAEFGAYMRRARTARGITLQTIATRLGWSVPYVGDIELAKRDPPSGEAVRVIAEMVGEDAGAMVMIANRSRRVVRIEQARLTTEQREALHALLESWGHPT